ncbi:MAG: hypothetical protein ACK4IY_08685 [Chitinophagales bacterium]
MSCEKQTMDPGNNYTGIFTGEVYYLEKSANPFTGYVEYDSTFSETIVIQPHGDDSIYIVSLTFGTRTIPLMEEEEYLITYGSNAAFTCRFAAGGDSVYMHSYSYSGIGPSNYFQLDMDFAGSQ